MKKIFLSLSLILSFTAYTLYVRILKSEPPIATNPQPNKPKKTLVLPQYNQIIPNTPKATSSTITSNTTSTSTKPQTVTNTGKYKNGNYTGNTVDAYYGSVQVSVSISGGKISDVQFLNYPQDRNTSVRINTRAMPYLISEAISIQDSNVDIVSGASFTSKAYRKSLASALSQAKI